MPPMTPAQTSAWHALLDLHARKPTGWTLIGGQMVHLLCAERGGSPARPTDDADTALDVRAEPTILHVVTGSLRSLGFRAELTPEGHQHRWRRADAVIDVLVPRGLGVVAESRRGVSGGTTLSAPGTQQALDRTSDVPVVVDGRHGTIRRPSVLGALVCKAAAYGVVLDRARVRHLTDLVVLSTLVRPEDRVGEAGRRDREHLGNALGELLRRPDLVAGVEGGDVGVARVRTALGLQGVRAAPATPVGGDPFAPRRRARR